MKTLLLLSHGQFLNNDLAQILNRSLVGWRVAHVTTAAKGTRTGMASFWKVVHEAFARKGCYVEDLDLDGKDENELRDILKKFNAVFVNGGNTSYLLKSIRKSGFDKVVRELLPQGFVYMGASAGAYVACPTIEAAAWNNKDKDTFGLTDLTAMNLVPFLLVAHYTPEFYDLLREKTAAISYATRVLTDEQAILVNDDEIKFLGGEEIKLI